MKKGFMFLMMLFLVITVYAEKQRVKINGNIKGLGTNQVVIIDGNRERIASCVAEKNKFSMSFDYDMDTDLRIYIYIPHLDKYNMPQPSNTYIFLVDVAEVNVTGKIKGDKIEKFRAFSPYNDVYNYLKYETASAKLRLKAEVEAEKVWNIWGRVRKHESEMTDEEKAEKKKILMLVQERMDAVSARGIECTNEAVSMLTSEINVGLNAFIYATGNTLKFDLLKPIVEKYLSIYSEDEMNKSFYTRELLKTYKMKGLSHRGSEIVDMDFVDLNGKIVHFSDFKGKYLYVNLYDVKYEPSMEELKQIISLEEKYKDSPIVFLNLNVNKDRDEWKSFCKEHGYINHINVNDNREFFGLYKVNDLPRGILIDPDLRMHTFYVGKLYGDKDKEGNNLNNGKTIVNILPQILK